MHVHMHFWYMYLKILVYTCTCTKDMYYMCICLWIFSLDKHVRISYFSYLMIWHVMQLMFQLSSFPMNVCTLLEVVLLKYLSMFVYTWTWTCSYTVGFLWTDRDVWMWWDFLVCAAENNVMTNLEIVLPFTLHHCILTCLTRTFPPIHISSQYYW